MVFFRRLALTTRADGRAIRTVRRFAPPLALRALTVMSGVLLTRRTLSDSDGRLADSGLAARGAELFLNVRHSGVADGFGRPAWPASVRCPSFT